MSQYRIRILNHTVMGYPYVPICKFQVSFTSKSKIDKNQQSSYVNPPLYNPKTDAKQMQPVSTPSTDSAYKKQFPIEFPLLTFGQSEELDIKLIQLTRNGRDKIIGYSKVILNAEVLGKSTRHKIIQIGQQSRVTKQTVKNQHVISIVQIGFVAVKSRQVSESKKSQIIRQDVSNPFKIPDNDTSRESQSQSQHEQNKSEDSLRQKYVEPQSQIQNQRLVFDSSKEFTKSPIKNDSYSSFKKSNFIHSNDQPFYTINQPKKQQSQQNTARRVLHRKQFDSPEESSYPVSRQSRVLSSDRRTGKIIRQKPVEKTLQKHIQTIEEAPVAKQTEFKHKRRLKYIFSSSQYGGAGPMMIEPKTQSLKLKNFDEQKFSRQQNEKQNKKIRKKYLQRMYTQANPTMPRELVEYFISNDQTDQKGCNLLTNLNIIYESAFGPFYPKYITFLTHKLYESIIRINCEQLKKHYTKKIRSPRQEDNYLLKTEEGQLYEPEVYNKFNGLNLYLPKYCLMLRVEIIMEDESVYVGTLANQCGIHLKCALQLKRTANMQNIQIKKEKERVNMIVNISENNILKEPQSPSKQSENPRIEHHDISIPSQITTKHLGKGKSIFEDERFFPHIARRLQTQQNKATAYMNFSTLNESKSKQEISTVEKTFHAIKSYKNILMAKDETQKGYQKLSPSPKNRQNRKEYINNHDNYLQPPKSVIEKKKKLLTKTRSIQSIHTPKQTQYDLVERKVDQPTQQQLTEIMNSKIACRKDLPKIIVQRSSKYNINESRKQTIFQNLQSQLSIKTRKRKISAKPDNEFSRDKNRINYFKKILNNKYGEYVSLNRQFQKKLLELNAEKRIYKSRSRQLLDEQLQQQRRRQNKIIKLYSKNLDNTKIFPSNLDRSSIKMVSCHDKCVKQIPMTKQLKEKKKYQNKSSTSLLSLAEKTKSDFKKAGKFNIIIKKLQYLKILEQQKGPNMLSKKFKSPQKDSENERWEQSSQGHKDQETFDVFLKVYTESKRQKEFITPSQKLIHAFSQPNSNSSNMQSPSQKSLNYMVTSWNVKESGFVFKNVKVSDMITVEAYGDMLALDNHEFMGRCIFTVQEMSYMRIQKKITGYLVRNKKIESHCTLHFDIEELI